MGSPIREAVLSADGTRLYVRTAQGAVNVLPSGSSRFWTVATLPSMGAFVVDEATKRLYAAERNFFLGKLVAIDMEITDALATPVAIGGASSILPDSAYARAWVHNHGSPNVSLVKLADLTVERQLTLDWSAARPSLSRDEKKLYLAEQYGSKIAVISTSTGEVTQTLDVGFDIERMWALTGTDRLFVSGPGRMTVIDTLTDGELVSHDDGSGSVFGIGESAAFDVVYAPIDGPGSMLVFDGSTGELLQTTRVPGYASGVTFTTP